LRKTIAAAAAALMLLAGAGTALANPSHDPRGDDNTHNDHGQCTAFFNGQKNGHPAFTDDDVEAIYDFCSGVVGGIGGQPSHGRFDCTDDPAVANTDEDNCADQ
jgi:hypothetical protein